VFSKALLLCFAGAIDAFNGETSVRGGEKGGGGENNTWAASSFMISAVGHSGVSVVVVLYKL
jgi:hypothetical protein